MNTEQSVTGKNTSYEVSQDPRKITQKMSYILRHHPESVGGLDEFGRTTLTQLAHALQTSVEMVLQIVEDDAKGRYAVENVHIWATQGHSIKGLKIPMQELDESVVQVFHGTKMKFLESILEKGLIPQTRTQVHLSMTEETARKVASRRRGKSVILTVDTGRMLQDGFKLFVSANGVVLTENVPPEYITVK